MSTSDSKSRFWQSLEAKARKPSALKASHDEFPDPLPVGTAAIPIEQVPRRDFFKMLGLSTAAVMAACSRAPEQTIVPFAHAPEGVTPGQNKWYASTCAGCEAGCGVLLKVRDGRPIKVEGNPEHPFSHGGLCAVGQATVLSLYDANRARGPSKLSAGSASGIAWDQLDATFRAGLEKARDTGRVIRVVTPAILGPSEEAALNRFLSAWPNAARVRFEPLRERSALADGMRRAYGEPLVPVPDFSEAELIAAFDADFLGTWVSPVAFTRQYTRARAPERGAHMARHVQVETMMTVSGAAADERWPVLPSQLVPALSAVVAELHARAGEPWGGAVQAQLHRAAEGIGNKGAALGASLWEKRGHAVVLCGTDDPAAQVLAAAANALLGNAPTRSFERWPDGADFDSFVEELRKGEVGAVVMWGANPVYAHPRGAELAKLLSQVPASASLSDRVDETAEALTLHAPAHTPLEAWGDAEPTHGLLSLRQPVVAPLRNTRHAVESLLTWSGVKQTAYDFLRERWRTEVYPRAEQAPLTFDAFWDHSVQLGFAAVKEDARPLAFRPQALSEALAAFKPAAAELQLILFPQVAMRDGRWANNGWLQELADPISKQTWGNTVFVSPKRAAAMKVSDGAVVRVAANGAQVELPARIQPGLPDEAVAIPVGYGRMRAGALGNNIGANAYPLGASSSVTRAVTSVVLAATGATKPLALTQTQASLEGRPHVRELSLPELLAGKGAREEEAAEPPMGSLWSGHEYKGHRWGMAVDLSACTGCSACVISCQAENNIPVVGADEVQRRREMHWLRIDRYYAGDEANPDVVHQPMMCQHCENAPCESVCPVVATVHSSEGLNQQVYNRCVGTRYCANNCPTKVRRFNWFNYHHDQPLERMVLNPDVVVRTRGVMEKCSMCVQRIEEGKAQARREGRPLRDGEIRTACQQSCPAQAIHFGDLNDPDSEVARLKASGRAYRVLEELNIGPAVSYLSKVRNRGSGGEHG